MASLFNQKPNSSFFGSKVKQDKFVIEVLEKASKAGISRYQLLKALNAANNGNNNTTSVGSANSANSKNSSNNNIRAALNQSRKNQLKRNMNNLKAAKIVSGSKRYTRRHRSRK
jgi:hypothetical protein